MEPNQQNSTRELSPSQALNHGRALIRSQDFESAYQLFSTMLEQGMESWSIWFELGNACMGLQKSLEAKKSFECALRLVEQQNRYLLFSWMDTESNLLKLDSRAFRRLKRQHEDIRSRDQVLDSTLSRIDERLENPQVGEQQSIRAEFEKLISLYPMDHLLLGQWAFWESVNGNSTEAEELAWRAVHVYREITQGKSLPMLRKLTDHVRKRFESLS